jgi:hypothetical protein
VARLAPVVVLLIAFAACGGGGDDSDDVRDTVRAFVEATNARDGDTLCGELLTQDYLEKTTGATGDGAEDACKQQLDLITGLQLKVISIGNPEIDGDRAKVPATIAISGRRTARLFWLAKEDGRWKLASGAADES